MKSILKISLLSLSVFLMSCGGGGIPGQIGDSIPLIAEEPDEGNGFEYQWSINSQPDASLISISDLVQDDNQSQIYFIPDAEGSFIFEVVISQYGDELSRQTFEYEIEGGEIEPVEIPETAKEDTPEYEEDSWLDETIEDTVPEVKEVVKIEKTPPPPPVKKKASVKKQKKAKPMPGSAIPHIPGRYTIQVASRKELNLAQKEASVFINAGYDAYIQKAYFKETDELWFRVRIGNYTDYQTALEVAQKIAIATDTHAWVDFVRVDT